jgi:hypothetical protein
MNLTGNCVDRRGASSPRAAGNLAAAVLGAR